ncbi:hypothetical protein OHB35_01050 [Streptomyces phaeochromogenes]|uniref:Uncharacterized protein n=1 Tax=Streptomyces phaeochromogenes TaxID=1923 RepID=A0ABZ1H075_STRPH|nr:hypothetical protein [Streptomyces phaeochromogenes]WSD11908.1 hypothetical protein OHB35_01050 [Streptomyces phaeochromogenes]
MSPRTGGTGSTVHSPDTLADYEVQQLKAVPDACPELEQAHELVRAFAQILAHRTGPDLPDWISTTRDA